MPRLQKIPPTTLHAPTILRDAIDDRGRYDAAKMAKLLDWSLTELAEYLGKDPSTVSRFGASAAYQEKLAALAAVVQELLSVMDNDLAAARAWFRTPLRAFDKVSPQHKILHGELASVDRLVNEFRSGLAL